MEDEAWYKEIGDSLQAAGMPEYFLLKIVEYCPYYIILRSLVHKWHAEENLTFKKFYFIFMQEVVDLIDVAEERGC